MHVPHNTMRTKRNLLHEGIVDTLVCRRGHSAELPAHAAADNDAEGGAPFRAHHDSFRVLRMPPYTESHRGEICGCDRCCSWRRPVVAVAHRRLGCWHSRKDREFALGCFWVMAASLTGRGGATPGEEPIPKYNGRPSLNAALFLHDGA